MSWHAPLISAATGAYLLLGIVTFAGLLLVLARAEASRRAPDLDVSEEPFGEASTYRRDGL
jgi:hypothetical protein